MTGNGDSLDWNRGFMTKILPHSPRVTLPDITVRPFDNVTPEDLTRIGYDWTERGCEEFVVEYENWFAKELAKNYPVAWIRFAVISE